MQAGFDKKKNQRKKRNNNTVPKAFKQDAKNAETRYNNRVEKLSPMPDTMKSIIILFILVAVIAVQGEIKLTKDNGYEGITIVVENHQEQHDDFIPALKELLQNASNYLYNSTDKMAYFGDVTVVVPSHWDLNGTENVTFVDSPIPLTAGDIRIDFPNPKYNNEPYTLQPGACSEPGKYIHMTMDFILNVNGTMQQDFGDDIGRTLVHEWAHFRYGVFDEYGGVKNKMYKQFYLDGDDFHPVTCEENIPGFFEREDGEECLFEDYNNGCIFKPAESEVASTSSIMYLPYLNSINQFCDDTVENGHNYKAPSPQNYQCGYTPTWNVLSAHNDFHPPTKKNFTKTNLRIIQPHVFAEPRFVIVMDISFSMTSIDYKIVELTKRVEKASMKYGMEISTEKSKVMEAGRQVDSENKQIAVIVNRQKLDQVNSFTYLGSKVDGSGKSEKEIRMRIGRATSALAKLENTWRAKNIAMKNKILLMRAIVESTLLYACESWTVSKNMEQKLRAFEMKTYRSMLGISWKEKKTNEWVRNKVKIICGSELESVMDTMKRRKFKYFGHMVRGGGMARAILECGVEGSRGRGRPMRNWLGNLKEWSGQAASVLTGRAEDRMFVTRLEYLNIAVTRFLSSIAPDNSQVSLVEFSDDATILSDLRIINSTSRNQLISKLPKKTDDDTCIGCGLLKAIEVLSSNGQTAAGGTIILITDGINTSWMKNITVVMNDVLKSKVVVDTIAIGVKASANLHLLSKSTGGSSSYFSGQPKDLLKLDSAFIVSVHRQKDVETEGIQLFTKSIVLQGNQTVTYVINVDPSLGNDTTFVIAGHSAINWLETFLISPLNQTYTESNTTVYKYDKIAFTKTFKLPKADSGKWKLIMSNTNIKQDYANVIVTSKQKTKDLVPIAVRCWLNSTVVDLSKCSNVVVFCHVLKGYDAVIRATVNVTVQGTKTSTIRLYDDGSGADTEADDGIYTSYFADFEANIRYSITGTVINDGKAQILKGTSASPAPRRYSGKVHGKPITKVPITSLKRAPPGYVPNIPKPVIKSAEHFQRSVIVDSFLVKNFKDFHPKTIPPSRVTDLTVVNSERLDNNTVNATLSWSTVGDNYDIGLVILNTCLISNLYPTAKILDIRYSSNHSYLLTNFEEADKVTDNDTISASLKPLPPHQIQTIGLELNGSFEDLNLYFALKTIDGDGNAAPLSNIAAASFIDISAIPIFQSKGHQTEKPEKPDSKSNKTTYIIVGSIIGGLVVIAVMTVIIYKNLRKQKLVITESQIALS
ncbi:Calcium-activated chloride channel regulator 4A [Nymphon striatum]|nr:Calcium-activated chloride channel regulator 4A [Nymphon striatum]